MAALLPVGAAGACERVTKRSEPLGRPHGSSASAASAVPFSLRSSSTDACTDRGGVRELCELPPNQVTSLCQLEIAKPKGPHGGAHWILKHDKPSRGKSRMSRQVVLIVGRRVIAGETPEGNVRSQQRIRGQTGPAQHWW
eukprot:6175426-Pleurochrysis_carterae.AAC.8